MKPVIVKEEPIAAAELKAELDAIKKRDGELNYRASRTEEYLKLFKGPTKTKVKELKTKLIELDVPRLKEDHIVKFIDLMPGSVAEMKNILQAYTVTVKEDNLKKILSVIDEYR